MPVEQRQIYDGMRHPSTPALYSGAEHTDTPTMRAAHFLGRLVIRVWRLERPQCASARTRSEVPNADPSVVH